jgi:membrane protein implicated in regulation of membrane protease activity
MIERSNMNAILYLTVLSCSVCSLLFCMFSLVLCVLSCSVCSLLLCMFSLVLYVLSCSVCSLLFCMFSLVLCVLSCSVCNIQSKREYTEQCLKENEQEDKQLPIRHNLINIRHLLYLFNFLQLH